MNVFLTNQFLTTKMLGKRADITSPWNVQNQKQNQDENNQQKEKGNRR